MMERYKYESSKLIFLEHQRAAAYGLYATFYNGLTEGIKAVALGTGGVLVARGARDLRMCCDSFSFCCFKAPFGTEGISPEQLTAPLGNILIAVRR